MRAFSSQGIQLGLKRLVDICGSLFGLILLAPLFLAIAAAIKLTSPGPVFFLQERLGKDGKVFQMMKFRTMVVGAEQMGDGLKVKNNQDQRITKIGKGLRVTSLDELPQLYHVLCGTMSLVGPRPPVTYFPYKGYENYPEWAKKRFTMRPGMTGLAQVTVRNAATWEERIKIDNQYIERFTIGLDCQVLCLTVKKVFARESIYFEQPFSAATKEEET